MIARTVLGLDWTDARVQREGAMPVLRLRAPRGVVLATMGPPERALQELRWFERDDTGALVEWARTRFEFATDAEPGVTAHPAVVWFEQTRPHVQTTMRVRARTVAPELPAQTFEPFE
jgi:hypothetical protein